MLLGALWEQNTYTLQLLLGAPSKAKYLHTRVSVEGFLKSSARTHCSGYLGALWKQSTYLSSALEYIVWVDNTFFTKNEENFRAKHLEGAPK